MVRVGGTEEIAIDVRVLTATNHAPETIIRDRRLREDLYYRLAVFVVRLPPLRQRGDDVTLLAQVFLDRLNHEYGTHMAPDSTDLRECIRVPLGMTMAEAERTILIATLRHCGGSKRRTAEMLGISVKTVYNKLVGWQDEGAQVPQTRLPGPRDSSSFGGAARIGGPCLQPSDAPTLLPS